ncbi:MAG: NfeD family protein [Thermomicrobiales bacterium]
MQWPTDTLAVIYLSLFLFGLLFTIVSMVLGAGEGHLHAGDAAHGHLHLPDAHGHAHAGGEGAHASANGGHAHAGDAQPSQLAGPSPFNLLTILVFITGFGAAGYVLRVTSGLVAAAGFLLAVVIGLAGAALIHLVLAKVLWRGQTQLDPLLYERTGTIAQVTSSIRAGGTGEIVYTLDDARMVDGARSDDGAAIPAGASVIILRYEGGLAYVRVTNAQLESSEFLGEPVEPVSQPPPRYLID